MYETYLGIPFAEPPLNELRWQPASEVQPWNGTWNATYYRPECIQVSSYNTDGDGPFVQDDEDCLYLNIFVPHGVQNL